MYSKNKICLIVCFILVNVSLQPFHCFGQSNPQVININSDTSNAESDTIIGKSTFLTLFEGKPGRAALYSLVIPGGGQLYNRKYWKFPLAVAIDGGVAWWLYFNRSEYKFYQRKLEEDLKMVPIPGNIQNTRAIRNGYRKRQEYAWLILFAGHMIPVMDAYVDRHMMDFDVSPDLSSISLNNGNEISYLSIKLSIPLK